MFLNKGYIFLSCGISINKEKVTDSEMLIHANQLINGKYLLVQKGKKNYSIIRAV